MKEKATTSQVFAEQPSDTERSDQQNSIERRVGTAEQEKIDVAVPHLHAKTFLAVFAVALIYFTQVLNVVGAGSVTKITFQLIQRYYFLTELV
jgi:hypothetical protein